MLSKKLLSRIVSISISGAVLGASAIVPAPASAESMAIEEVIVSARRRNESLQDVPLSVSSYSGDELEKTGTPDIVQLAEGMPNTTLKVSRGTNTTITAFIRGVGQQDPVAGFESGVGIYIDDIYLNRPQGAVLDVYDVERIEVLRGPQGTLYGRNTIGGAIKYVTRRLSDEPELRLKGSLGNFDQVDMVVTGSLPLSDTLRVGGTVASFQRDGFGTNLFTGDEHYDKDIMAARISAEWTPADSLFFRFSADYSDDDSNPKGGHRLTPGLLTGAPVLNDVYDTRSGITEVNTLNENKVTQSGASLLAEWSVSETTTLKSITSYREDRTESPIDFDSLPGASFDVPVIYDNQQFSQEFQVLFEGEKIQGVAGAYYLEANAFDAFDVVLSSLNFTSFTLGDVDTTTWAVFGDLSYDLTETVSLSVGARFTRDKRESVVTRESFLGLGSPYFDNTSAVPITVPVFDSNGQEVVPTFSGERDDEDFTPRVSLSWQPREDLHLYASYSAGFKGGGFDPRGAYGIEEIRDGFDPETVDAYEVGVKTELLDGRLKTNAAVFYSDYKDVQIPGSEAIDTDDDGVDDSFQGTVTNAGAAEITGAELELTAYLTDSLRADAAIGYIDAEYEEFEVGGVNLADQRVFQNTPEWTAFYAMTYDHPLALLGRDGELSLIGSLSYRSETHQFEITNPLLDQSGYSLINASVVWSSNDGKWQVGLHGKNLSDKEYKVAGYNFPTLGEGVITAFYGNPRTITGTLNYNF